MNGDELQEKIAKMRQIADDYSEYYGEVSFAMISIRDLCDECLNPPKDNCKSILLHAAC